MLSDSLIYILILPKLFYLQTSVKSQRSYIGRQASCLVIALMPGALCLVPDIYIYTLQC